MKRTTHSLHSTAGLAVAIASIGRQPASHPGAAISRHQAINPESMAAAIRRLAVEQGKVDWRALTTAGFTPADIARHLSRATQIAIAADPAIAPRLDGLRSPATEVATRP